MEDYGPQSDQARTGASDALCSFLARYGYRRVETPVLEQTELLLRKSGGELASRMYTFTDPGGHRVSLRPEFTSSVVRAYLQGMHGGVRPTRWSYMGPVFRYEPEEGADHRQFTQMGAEIIGADGPWADAEVLAMACKGLSHIGIAGCQLVVGHLGFIGALLESLGLSDRARLFLMESLTVLSRGLDGLREVKRRAQDLGLLQQESTEYEVQTDAPNEAALALLEGYLQATPSPAIGVRTPQEIRERFLRKQSLLHDAGRFGGALDLLAQVVQVKGEPAGALSRVRAMVEAPQPLEELDNLAETLQYLSHYHLDGHVSVDFGLARGIAYYTGVVFEVRHAGVEGASLGGGGRYDGLVQALGGPEHTPAMGFAWSLERVVDVFMAQSAATGAWKPRMDALLVRPDTASAAESALVEAERLRAQGKTVELEVTPRSMSDCVQYAQAQGIGQIITVNHQGKVTHKDVPERQ